MTYGDLKDDITSFLQRSGTSISSVIPTWVRFATANFNRKLRIPDMESRDTTQLTSEYTALPTDILEIITVSDAGGPLVALDRARMDQLVVSGVEPSPAAWAVEDYQLRVRPAPTADDPLTVTLVYYERIAELVDDDDTNWLLDEHPDLYLYGSLIHARAWLHDEPRLANVKALHDEALADLKRRKTVATGRFAPVAVSVPVGPSVYDITRG